MLKEEGPHKTRVLLSVDYSLQGPLAQFSRGGLVKELVARMAAEFGANLDRRLSGARETAVQLDAGGVFWKWLWQRIKSLFN